MHRVVFIVILIFFTCLHLHSQGFNWQYTTRYPIEAPSLFLGLNSSYNHSSHHSNIDLREYFVHCCQFNDGSAKGFSIGASAEKWFSGNSSALLSLLFKNQSVSFYKIERLPRLYDSLTTQYELNSIISNISLEIGGKRRLFDSHFHLAASLFFSYLFNTSNKYSETVLEPMDFPWRTRVISSASFSDINRFNIFPNLRAGYDWSFYLNYYASFFLQANIPLFDLAKDKKWKSSSIEFGFIIFKGID
ncbi:MAG: hypothetical protein GX121_09240 [Ignavibacteria bacterium]|nr:hypothetical protein [Ignavibacteria bacterium]